MHILALLKLRVTKFQKLVEAFLRKLDQGDFNSIDEYRELIKLAMGGIHDLLPVINNLEGDEMATAKRLLLEVESHSQIVAIKLKRSMDKVEDTLKNINKKHTTAAPRSGESKFIDIKL